MNKSLQSILDEYKAKSSLYKDFSLEVSSLLERILKNGDYKYQISYRIKSLESLKEKIKRKALQAKFYKHLGDIEDVLGIRIVFYTESDRKKFIKNLSHELGSDAHYKEINGESGYHSTHAIVSFGKKRSGLIEYSQFKNLKCEVQMTLILNHAWAEVEHNILYKKNGHINGLAKSEFSSLKSRMEKVMANYIKVASNELESIMKKINGIKVRK